MHAGSIPVSALPDNEGIYLEKPSRVTEGVRSAPRCLQPQIDATTTATDISIIK
jgi:hypothetical protein